MTVTSQTQQRAVAALKERLPVDRVLTAGPEYTAGTALWNGAVTFRPAILLRCTSTAEVQTGVRTAREFGLPLSVRGGGHDWAGRALSDQGLTLDLTPMSSVHVDVGARRATVAGGARTNHVLAAADPYGMVAATGTVGTVGMAGLTLGGGYGPLGGRFGLAADNLAGAEVVLADGSVVWADAEHEPDLFWALRGGGGNFGVVTSMEIRLHTVPAVVTGMVLYPLRQAPKVFARLGALLADCPDELTVQTGIINGPDGAPMAMLWPTWSGEPAVGTDPSGPVQRLTRLGTPAVAEFETGSFATAIAARDTMFPNGRHVSLRTRSLPRHTPEVVDALVQGAKTMTSPLSAFSVHHFHGAAARVPWEETAFALRKPHMMAEVLAVWTPETDGGRHTAWADAASAALEPHAFAGGYANLLGPDATDQIPHVFGGNTARLLAVKDTVDPDGVFRGIPLPMAEPRALSHR
ncbi:FAD-dependent oxidoreductase [Streptomyces melanosporofaciens]|uniref:FAD/FMN-containing dehydrogenase n=1 Tax=Streptomyces melanosporofaciens TaxID=67327 RepID=A0A1H4YTV5_STRMJ|nr:FAD-binding oxidoreductase [Streptomyces melanosporofaciens]SED21213.1 FAD/FMN-containing dehydrogenase [Streptomyces melanosporofaciens]